MPETPASHFEVELYVDLLNYEEDMLLKLSLGTCSFEVHRGRVQVFIWSGDWHVQKTKRTPEKSCCIKYQQLKNKVQWNMDSW